MKNDHLNKMKLMYPDGDIKDENIVFKNAGWGTKESQELRYDAVNSIYASLKKRFIAENKIAPRVLEIGCGFGIFYSRYIKDENYYGVDLNPQAVQYCTDKYGSDKFSIMDMTTNEFFVFLSDFKADYVIASGVFDHAYIWKAIHEERLLHRIIDQTQCAIIFTMLHDVTPISFRNTLHNTIYSSPIDILKLFSSELYQQKLFFQIRSDYMDNDYTFALIKSHQLLLDKKYRKWKGINQSRNKRQRKI
jgi:SAM-dependent methyltransferase